MGQRINWCKYVGVAAGLVAATLVGGGAAGATPAPVPVGGEIGADSLEIAFETPPAPNVAGGCEALAIAPQFASAPCTLFSSLIQVPEGDFTIEQAVLHTGPRTGQMRFEVIRAIRSQLPGPGGQPSPVACCFQQAASGVFTPTPNTLNTIDLELPAMSEIADINGEPVEVFDYLVLTLLDFDSSLPILARKDFPLLGQLGPADANGLRGQGATFFNAVTTFSATACPTDGSGEEDVCQQVGPSGESFTGVTPSRQLDTRSSGRVAAGSTTRVQIGGVGGVPGDATAAVLNVTAVAPSEQGFLTVFPCGEDQPGASNVNFRAGQTVANAAIATLGRDGGICVFSSAETNLLVDVNGAVTDGFAGLNPERLLDTRGSGRVAAGSTTRVAIAGADGVPAGAVAAVLNVTAVAPSEKGFLSVFPCGEDQPGSSNVNFEAERTVPNAVVATIGAGGEVCVFSSVETNLLVDLSGAVSAGFAGLVPERLLDTRGSGRVAAGSTTRVAIAGAGGVPAGAVAAVLNVTAVAPSEQGFLSVFPCGEDQPGSSNVNFAMGQTVANAAVATLGAGGEICVFSSVETNLLVDLNGVFT